MQKFTGRVAKLSDVMTGFGTVESAMTEDEFVKTLKDIKWKWLPLTTPADENEGIEEKVVGFFNDFYIEESNGVKYVCGTGFLYDGIDIKSVESLKNFSLEILPQDSKHKGVSPVSVHAARNKRSESNDS